MTEHEIKALRQIEAMTDVDQLRQMVRNARGKSPLVEKAAFRRIISVSTPHEPGTVQYDCWRMVHTVEELRRLSGRKVSRMNHMRPKIKKDGEIVALEYCALERTAGFDEVIDYGMPELTAEAIVLRHADHFTAKARTAALSRLEQAGFEIDSSGQLLGRPSSMN